MLQVQHQECTSEKEEEKKSPQYSRTTKRSTEITRKKMLRYQDGWQKSKSQSTRMI